MRVEGRVWVFGDNLNTDQMYPTVLSHKADGVHTPGERRALAFSGVRPGWSDLVTEGDIIVAGHNLGTGSARAAPTLIREIGIAGVVADSVNGLFFRNCVNAGLGVMECDGITSLVTEGDRVRVDFSAGAVEHVPTGRTLRGSALPQELLGIIEAGGVMAALTKAGYLEDLSQPGR